MGRIIAIANQKGGVGKTTTTINLGASLAHLGARTLLVDVDPQSHTGSGLGIASAAGPNVYQVLMDGVALDSAVQRTEIAGLFVAPASPDLAGAEVELVNALAREQKLQRAFRTLTEPFDYVLVDCPPTLGLLTINALTAAGSVLIPLQPEYFALEGLARLLSTIEQIRAALNPSLSLEGILLTMFDVRNNLSHQVATEVRQHFNGQVFQTIIPRNVRLSEASSHGKPILLYDGQSRGSESYIQLAAELCARHGYAAPGSATA
jgi:chromosome partitioning protein